MPPRRPVTNTLRGNPAANNKTHAPPVLLLVRMHHLNVLAARAGKGRKRTKVRAPEVEDGAL
jgi:hypothetical protein